MTTSYFADDEPVDLAELCDPEVNPGLEEADRVALRALKAGDEYPISIGGGMTLIRCAE